MNEKEEKKLPDQISYNGYIIRPHPLPLVNNRWSLNIDIEKHSSEGIISRNFFAKNIYKTKEEAIKNCYIFGKQIIDGKYEGVSVTGM